MPFDKRQEVTVGAWQAFKCSVSTPEECDAVTRRLERKMTDTVDATFSAWVKRAWQNKPGQDECEEHWRLLASRHNGSLGHAAKFKTVLDKWNISLDEDPGYRDIQDQVTEHEKRENLDLNFAINALTLVWDPDFARHVLLRYQEVVEGTKRGKRNAGHEGKYFKALKLCSLLEQEVFCLLASHEMFRRHTEKLDANETATSLGGKHCFLLLKEVQSIAETVKKNKYFIRKVPTDDAEATSHEIDNYIATQDELVDFQKLARDQYGMVMKYTASEKLRFVSQSPSARSAQSASSSHSLVARSLSTVSFTTSAGLAHAAQNPLPDPIRIAQSPSLSGETVVGVATPKQVTFNARLTVDRTSEPETADIFLSDGSLPDTMSSPAKDGSITSATPYGPAVEETTGESQFHVANDRPEGPSFSENDAMNLLHSCFQISHPMDLQLASFTAKCREEASLPDASESALRMKECVNGSWASRLLYKAYEENPGRDEAEHCVIVCSAAQMMRLADTQRVITSPCVIPALDRLHEDSLQQLSETATSKIEHLELFSRSSACEPQIAMNVAQAPVWPPTACATSRFALLPKLLKLSHGAQPAGVDCEECEWYNVFTSTNGGDRGSFRRPVAYDWCGTWVRLTFGTAIVSFRQCDGHSTWRNVCLTSGDTIYLSAGFEFAICCVTFCTFYEYVTWDAASLVRHLEEMAMAPILPKNIHSRVRILLPRILEALSHPTGVQNLVGEGCKASLAVHETLRDLKDQCIWNQLVET